MEEAEALAGEPLGNLSYSDLASEVSLQEEADLLAL